MTARVKLDFITWHTYPNFKADPTAIPGAHRNVQAVLDRKKAQYPELNVQNYLTEWNSTYLGGDSFHHEMAASFVAKTIHGLFANQNNGVKAPDAAAFKSFLKAAILSDRSRDFLANQVPPYNIWAREILSDPSIAPLPDTSHLLFEASSQAATSGGKKPISFL